MSERRSNLAIPIAIVVGLVLAAVVLGLLLRSDGGGAEEAAAPTATPTPSATAGGARREPNAITIQQARNVPLGSTRRGIVARFGPPKPADPELPARIKDVGQCVYYNFAGTPEGDIRLCFRDGRLAAVTTVYP